MRSISLCVRISFPYLALGIRFVVAAFVLHLTTGHAASADDGTVDAGLVFIENTQVRGLIHTKEETIWSLLPRPVPGRFTPRNSPNLNDASGT